MFVKPNNSHFSYTNKLTAIKIGGLLLFFLLPIRTLAQDSLLGRNTRDTMNLWLEVVIFAGFFVLAFQNYRAHKAIGNSLISIPFVYLFIGFFILFLARIFLVLYEFQVYMVMPMVIGIYWHVFVYLAMISFLISIEKIRDRSKDKEIQSINTRDYLFFGIVGVLVSLAFLTPQGLGTSIMMFVMKTFIPKFGVLHFIAFLFTAILTYRMIKVVNISRKVSAGKYLEAISSWFLIFLIVTTLNHLALLLTESWKVVIVDEHLLGVIEQSFWVIGFAVMVFGFQNLQKIINLNIASHEVEVIKADEHTEMIRHIMEVLHKHLGSVAGQILHRSSMEIGIDLIELDENNVDNFVKSVQQNSLPLIGDFPSKYLGSSIKKIVIA